MDDINEMLAETKLLLSVTDEEQDEVLELIINDTINAVLAYCRIEVLPRQLVSLIPLIASKRFTENGTGGVKSITEGDRRVEYCADSASGIPAGYESRLKPFVNRSVKLPSDLTREKNEAESDE